MTVLGLKRRVKDKSSGENIRARNISFARTAAMQIYLIIFPLQP